MGGINETTGAGRATPHQFPHWTVEPWRKLKVCITSRAPFIGGAELAAERLAIGLRGKGHEAFFLLGKRGEVMQRLEDAGFRCVVVPVRYTDKRRFWRYLAARSSLRGLFKRERPDVIHANDLPSAQMFFDAARGLSVTRICHHRFIYDREAIDWFNKFEPDRHVFVSHALQDELSRRSLKLASQPGTVVYDGLPIPQSSSQRDKAEARQALDLPLNRAVVTFAGQIIERKGVAELIQAWAHLRDMGAQPAELVIVGDDVAGMGKYRQQMQQLAHLLNVQPRFVGFQKNVGPWLVASDIAVVPSHVEPLGNATLEAMSHGLPVIGADVGGIPEMIVNECTGVIVPPKDPLTLAQALERLINNIALRHRLGEAARQRCQTLFSLEAHADAMLYEYAAARGQAELRKAA